MAPSPLQKAYLAGVQSLFWLLTHIHAFVHTAFLWLADRLSPSSSSPAVLAAGPALFPVDRWSKVPRHIGVVVDSELLPASTPPSASMDASPSLRSRRHANGAARQAAGTEAALDASSSRVHGILSSTVYIIRVCLELGIPHMTLYDEQGTLKANASRLAELISQDAALQLQLHNPSPDRSKLSHLRIMVENRVFWESSVSSTQPRAYEPRATPVHAHQQQQQQQQQGSLDLTVYLKSHWDGKDALARAARDLACANYPVSMEAIKERLLDDFPVHSDPDLIFIVGGGLTTTLHNYSPWSLRLTEFHHVPSLNSQGELDRRDFRRGMAKYAKCEQRFGK